jgi:peptidoglycan/LPS O-acetylase OafA/YrhL
MIRRLNSNAGRIPSLDGIRAIAIASVLVCHFCGDLYGTNPLNLGELGVRIFFVLSGYLITTLLLKELERTGNINLRHFYFRRTMRIFPPFYFYLGVMLAFSIFHLSSLTVSAAWPALTYTSNLFRKLGPSSYAITHTWSLSIEEQFYLVWPLLLVLAGKRRAPWLLVSVLVLGPLVRGYIHLCCGVSIGGWDLSRVGLPDHIATGCLLAFFRVTLQANAAYIRLQRSRAFIVVPVLVVLANSENSHLGIIAGALRLALNVLIALCIDWAITNHTGMLGRALNSRIPSSIGVLSYSLYLWQQPFTHLHLAQPAIYLHGRWQIIATPVISLISIFACACFSYFAVERPSLRFRERLEAGTIRSDRENASVPVTASALVS